MKKNFWLDIILFISALICILTGIQMDFHIVAGDRNFRFLMHNLHKYSGYIMAIGLVIHIVWHTGWIKGAFKNIFKKNSH